MKVSVKPPASIFRTSFSENIFNSKYAHEGCETWEKLSKVLIEDVCGNKLPRDIIDEMVEIHSKMLFIAGGRYLYYAGRPLKFFNNCYLFKAEEDTREDWADMSYKHVSALMTGGGIGTDYSIYRAEGTPLSKTGGYASGPISKMIMSNEEGRQVMQGGSRRSAMWATLNWMHKDIRKFLHIKDWYNMPVAGTGGLTVGQLKEADFNFPAPLDMTNISVSYDNDFLSNIYDKDIIEIQNNIDNLNVVNIPETFLRNCLQALRTGEPGMSFNFFDKEKETLRNACCEITSEDDSDVCNLGSINMGVIEDIETFKKVVQLGTLFLLCGTMVSQLPHKKIYDVRDKNRRIGLGLMGVHEWLMKRGYDYKMNEELIKWLEVYRDESNYIAKEWSNKLSINEPKGKRAIAPTGTIGIMGATTTGIEPLFAVAYKRRYLIKGSKWMYEYVIDGTAKVLIEQYGLKPESIETSVDLANDYARRIEFQADVQDFVDHGISSTINLPEWKPDNDMLLNFAGTLAKFAHRLRGFTCYPNGARGGQPITPVPYYEALELSGKQFAEEFNDICKISGNGGSCGI